MSQKTLPKWLKIGIPVVLGVLVVAGALAYSTNSEMFQGFLQLRPAATTNLELVKKNDIQVPVNKFDKKSPGTKSNPTETECIDILAYHNAGYYSGVTPPPGVTLPPLSDVQFCRDNFPNAGMPTETECIDILAYHDAGYYSGVTPPPGVTLPPLSDVQFCRDNFPNAGIALSDCMILKGYAVEGTLTANLGGDLSSWQACLNAYPSEMEFPSISECMDLKGYLNQGTLSQMIADGDVEYLDNLYCADTYHALWFDVAQPSYEDCADLKMLLAQGTLSDYIALGLVSNEAAVYCAENHTNLWHDLQPSYDYCVTLKELLDQGVLSDQIDAGLVSLYDNQQCAAFYQGMWFDSSPGTACKGFSDVPPGHKYYDAIQYVAKAGIIDNYPVNCEFRPDNHVNRAEGAKLMVVGFDLPLISGSAQVFPDVEPTAWFFDYVATVYKNGVMTGYPDGFFKPANTVNRAEMIKMFVNAYNAGKTVPTVTLEKTTYSCPDFLKDDSNSWYAPYFVFAKESKLFDGPCIAHADATRAEFAAMFYYAYLVDQGKNPFPSL